MRENSKCPLCNADATFDYYDGKNMHLYHCDNCSDFFISRSAEKWLNQHEQHRKAYFAVLAASYKGKERIFVITNEAGKGCIPGDVIRNHYRK